MMSLELPTAEMLSILAENSVAAPEKRWMIISYDPTGLGEREQMVTYQGAFSSEEWCEYDCTIIMTDD